MVVCSVSVNSPTAVTCACWEHGCADDREPGCAHGCELGCADGCEPGCAHGCELGCVHGCADDCEPGCAHGCELGYADGCEPGCADGSDEEDAESKRQTIFYPNGGEGSHFQLDEMFKIFVESEFCPQTLFHRSKSNNYFAPHAHRHCHLASILLPYEGLFGVQGSSPNIGGYHHTRPVGRC